MLNISAYKGRLSFLRRLFYGAPGMGINPVSVPPDFFFISKCIKFGMINDVNCRLLNLMNKLLYKLVYFK